MENCFRLEIHGLAEFAAFVALIRGQPLDATTLRDLTARLTSSTADLADAEATAAGAAPPPSSSSTQ